MPDSFVEVDRFEVDRLLRKRILWGSASGRSGLLSEAVYFPSRPEAAVEQAVVDGLAHVRTADRLGGVEIGDGDGYGSGYGYGDGGSL